MLWAWNVDIFVRLDLRGWAPPPLLHITTLTTVYTYTTVKTNRVGRYVTFTAPRPELNRTELSVQFSVGDVNRAFRFRYSSRSDRVVYATNAAWTSLRRSSSDQSIDAARCWALAAHIDRDRQTDGPRTWTPNRRLPLEAASVSNSQVGVLSKRLNESGWVLAWELSFDLSHSV